MKEAGKFTCTGPVISIRVLMKLLYLLAVYLGKHGVCLSTDSYPPLLLRDLASGLPLSHPLHL